MSIKPLLNSSSKNNKTLNLFSNQIEVNNVNTTNINGSPYVGGGGLTNPLTENLKLGGYAIREELGSIAPSLVLEQVDLTKDIRFKIAGFSKLDVSNNKILSRVSQDLNGNNIDNVGNINAEKILNTNTEIDMGVFAPNSLLLKSTGGLVGLQETTTTNNIAVQNTANAMTALQGDNIIRNLGAGGLQLTTLANDIILSSGTNILYQSTNGHQFSGNSLEVNTAIDTHFCDINMNNNDIYNLNKLNGLSPIGGLSSGLSPSNILTAATVEQSILPNTFLGSRTVFANSFKKGDSFTSFLAGNFSSLNGDTITIRLYGGPGASILLSNIAVPLLNSSGVAFELRFDFVIQEVGVAGVAQIGVNYQFSYQGGGGANFQGTRKVEINNSNFDTTIQNDLNVTAQFSSASASNSIETLLSTLTKTY